MAIIPLLGNRIDRLTGIFPLDFPGGDIADIYAYSYTEREIEVCEINNRKMTKPELSDRFGHFTVSTQYVPIYRILLKKHFYPGSNYPKNWEPSERKKQRNDRYSPFGTEGFYFGLTLKAAEDEVKYYSRGKGNGDDSMILVIECCFDNILYLTAGAILSVWEACGLKEPCSMIDMYLQIMDPRTDNPITNAIGLWARKQGFDGLIYPSARYGQEEELQKKKAQGFTLVPAINFVDVGSHLCRDFVALKHFSVAIMEEIKRLGGLKACIPVYAETNIVLFNGQQLSGERRAVVYQTFPLEMREDALQQDDDRRQCSSYSYFAG